MGFKCVKTNILTRLEWKEINKIKSNQCFIIFFGPATVLLSAWGCTSNVNNIFFFLFAPLLLFSAILFFVFALNAIEKDVYKIKLLSAGSMALLLFLIAAEMAIAFIIFFALIYKGISIRYDHGSMSYINYLYTSSQYFFNTGATLSNPKMAINKYFTIGESLIGYSFFPAYIGAFFYILSKKDKIDSSRKG
ncbi:hypothetical protein HAP67_08455 [Acidithiobacillus albertensis]|nr:hypothetical protein [Acidithiobacillus albertensis]